MSLVPAKRNLDLREFDSKIGRISDLSDTRAGDIIRIAKLKS